MKKIFAIALAAAAIFGFSASAQTQNACPKAKDCPKSVQANDNKMYKPQRFTDYAFEGILLDVNQQQRIDSLNKAMQPGVNCPNAADTAKCDKPNCPKKGKDGVANRPMGKKHGKGRVPCPEYVNKVKEILTPDQYTLFLENIVLQPAEGPAGFGKAPCQNADSLKCPKGKDCKMKDCKKGKDCKMKDCKKGKDCKDKANRTKDGKQKKDKK